MATDAIIVLTTFPGSGDATALARTLVEERLAACVNVLPPMTSVYRWKASIEEEQERQLVIKTTTARAEALRERLRALHPYEIPEFLVLSPSDGSREYLEWLTVSTL
jgi:periplasmic divalent cation tolerance protein